jgi:hypothetical protein
MFWGYGGKGMPAKIFHQEKKSYGLIKTVSARASNAFQ